ncbi:beta-1,3-galactosyltransferase 5-like [Scyliorhinus torazame]|uniref:beta-1,3-galactosyltransferase 5-like n=1 Tax=Scyliorhinus torazame TaxID=75743 RepID=UPI003B58D99D
MLCICLCVPITGNVYLRYNSPDNCCDPDLNDANFLTRPDSNCNADPPFLVLLVVSAQGEYKARSAIRHTWGRERTAHGKRAVTYFLLGYSRKHQARLLREQMLHKDIIQKDFNDTYYNLTIKVLMGLQCVTRFCSSSNFEMETDSDMFVNVAYLIELLSHWSPKDIFTGDITRNAKVIREESSKWYVNGNEYPLDNYPPFCTGSGYVLSTDVACRVWKVSRRIRKLKLEDVFLGLCIVELHLDPVQIHGRQLFHNSNVPFSVCAYRNLVTSHAVHSYQQLIYQKAMEAGDTDDCPYGTWSERLKRR